MNKLVLVGTDEAIRKFCSAECKQHKFLYSYKGHIIVSKKTKIPHTDGSGRTSYDILYIYRTVRGIKHCCVFETLDELISVTTRWKS